MVLPTSGHLPPITGASAREPEQEEQYYPRPPRIAPYVHHEPSAPPTFHARVLPINVAAAAAPSTAPSSPPTHADLVEEARRRLARPQQQQPTTAAVADVASKEELWRQEMIACGELPAAGLGLACARKDDSGSAGGGGAGGGGSPAMAAKAPPSPPPPPLYSGPNSHRTMAWAACLCCPITGAFALRRSREARRAWGDGDGDGASAAARGARRLSLVSFALGALLLAGVVAAVVAAVLLNASIDYAYPTTNEYGAPFIDCGSFAAVRTGVAPAGADAAVDFDSGAVLDMSQWVELSSHERAPFDITLAGIKGFPGAWVVRQPGTFPITSQPAMWLGTIEVPSLDALTCAHLAVAATSTFVSSFHPPLHLSRTFWDGSRYYGDYEFIEGELFTDTRHPDWVEWYQGDVAGLLFLAVTATTAWAFQVDVAAAAAAAAAGIGTDDAHFRYKQILAE